MTPLLEPPRELLTASLFVPPSDSPWVLPLPGVEMLDDADGVERGAEEAVDRR